MPALARITFRDAQARRSRPGGSCAFGIPAVRRRLPRRPTPAPDSVAGPQTDAPADSLWLEQRQSVAEERVLAEIAHELGNFFHKLYYWAEFLQEKRADHCSEAHGRADARPTRSATSRSS